MMDIRKMFCIKCGEDTLKGETFCEKCFLENKNLFSLKSEHIELSLCECGKIFDNGWVMPESVRDGIKNIIINNINKENESQIKHMDISLKQIGTCYKATIEATGCISPAKKTINTKRGMFIKIRKMKCEICTKRSGKYYEAVIQIRGENEKRIFNKLLKAISSPKEETISRLEPARNGLDVRFFDKKEAENVAAKLRKPFKVIKSFKLVGTKKNKKLYRNYYSVR